MKSYLLLFGSLLLATSIFAQEQTGLVREQNSNKRAISGVQIIFEDAVPTTSDNNGVFTLSFAGKKEGDLIFYEEIRKSGYEIVNEKELEVLKIGRTNQLGTDIILAKAGLVDAAKKEYYEVSDDALIAGFNNEKRALRAKLEATQLSQKEYLNQLTTLQEQYDRQKQSLDALAEKFARINLDDVDTLFKEALLLFKSGDIIGCKNKLESANLLERTDKMIKKRELLDKERSLNEQNLKKAIQPLQLQIETYLLSFEFDKAENLYEQLLRLDSTDLDIIQAVADFYRKQHLYSKAIHMYPKIIYHSNADDRQVANANIFMGDLYSLIGNYNHALQYYDFSKKSYQNLLVEYDTNSIYKFNLAISNGKLGETYYRIGDVKKAFHHFEEYNLLITQLYKNDTSLIQYQLNLALSNSKLGLMEISYGELEKGLEYYNNELILTKELLDEYPNDENYKNNLAAAYSRLALTYKKLGDLETALEYSMLSSSLFEELKESYPKNIQYKFNLAISYHRLGSLEGKMWKQKSALDHCEKSLELCKSICEDYPSNSNFRNSLGGSYTELGNLESQFGNFDMALYYYARSKSIFEMLNYDYPSDIIYKSNLVIAYNNIGKIQLRLYDKKMALTYFEKNLFLLTELFKNDPSNLNIKDDMESTLYILGSVFNEIENPHIAKPYIHRCYLLLEELYNDYNLFERNWLEFQMVIKDYNSSKYIVISDYYDNIFNEPIIQKKYEYYEHLCDTLRVLAKTDAELNPLLSIALAEKSWHGFFLAKYEQIENDIYENKSLDINNNEFTANLILAILFQEGRYKEAVNMFNKRKDESDTEAEYLIFEETVISNLNLLENAQIVPSSKLKDVSSFKKMILEKY